MVTHDLKSARRGDTILYLRDGEITGELKLGVYTSETDARRNEILRSFLAEMEW
jgi:putative ABC transport system ATP-binding protein